VKAKFLNIIITTLLLSLHGAFSHTLSAESEKVLSKEAVVYAHEVKRNSAISTSNSNTKPVEFSVPSQPFKLSRIFSPAHRLFLHHRALIL
jgi:hypothetical protein